MLECVVYKIRLVRKIGNVESTITMEHGVPSDWRRREVLEWVGYLWGDLIDAGWDARIERVNHDAGD